MSALLFLIPLFVITISGNIKLSPELLEILANAINISTPRVNGLPSPFTYGVMTFYFVKDRNPIRMFTDGKSGIYCWVNNINGKCYVGKGVNLYLRLSNYYQEGYLKRTRASSQFSKAILKHGIYAFSLVILEVNPADLAQAEQYWIDFLKPEYNTITNVLVPYDPSKRKPDRSGPNNSFFQKQHTAATKEVLRQAALARIKPNRPGFEFIIHDTLLDKSHGPYSSIRKGVEFME